MHDKTLDKMYFETLHTRHTSDFMLKSTSTLSVLYIPWLYGKMHHNLKSNPTSYLSSIFVNWGKYYVGLKLAIICNKSIGHLHFTYTLGSGAFSTAMTLLLVMLEFFSTYYMTTISTTPFVNIYFSLFRTSPHSASLDSTISRTCKCFSSSQSVNRMLSRYQGYLRIPADMWSKHCCQPSGAAAIPNVKWTHGDAYEFNSGSDYTAK
jgi:hypothetical protein